MKNKTKTMQRMQYQALRLIAVSFFALTVIACSANEQHSPNESTDQTPKPQSHNQASMPLEILHSTSQCGSVSENQWITSQEGFARLYQATRRTVISPTISQSPEVDFEKHGVLLLTMGQQRTGGYAIKLAGRELVMEGPVAVVRINWQEPRPGMMVTQALTNPCVFIKVPRGSYHTLRVVDQRNTVRAEFSVN